MKLYLARPSGFCAGVRRAVDIVDRSQRDISGTIYVRHQIVHNRTVVDSFRQKDVVFVEDVAEVPIGAHMIMSAHGAGRKIFKEASARRLDVVDATCPLVKKVHTEIRRFHTLGFEVILIGDKNHVEVQASADQSDGVLHIVRTPEDAMALEPADTSKLAYVTQTTLSVDDCMKVVAVLMERFPSIGSPKSSDICYAAQNRQTAVKELAEHTKHIIIVGSSNSSNAKRLRDVAQNSGATACLLDDPNDLGPEFLVGAETVGLSAAASTPQVLSDRFIERLKELGVTSTQEIVSAVEDVHFPLPAYPTQEVIR